MEYNDLSTKVIGCAIEVHRNLDPGLLESTYEQCFAHELRLAGILFELQKGIPVGLLINFNVRLLKNGIKRFKI